MDAVLTRLPTRQRTVVGIVFSTLALVGSAFLMSSGLSTTGAAWLGWVALLPLFASIRFCRPSRALWAGAIWGLSLYGFAAGRPDSALQVGLLPLLLLALVPAAYTLFGAYMTRWIGFSPFVLGVSWMGVELAFRPLGLRHGLLAGLHSEGALIQYVGAALGYVLVAFVVAYVSALVLSVLVRVRVSVSVPLVSVACGDGGRWLLPQTVCVFTLFKISSLRPRAPPPAPCPA